MIFLLILPLVLAKFTVYITNFTNMMSCSKTGAEYEILSLALSSSLISEPYEIKCTSSFEDMKTLVKSEPAIGFGGVTISKSLLDEGFKFTYPTYYSGLNILIKDVSLSNPLKLLNAFTFSLWVLYMLAPLFMGLVAWSCAFLSSNDPKRDILNLSSFLSYTWEAYSAAMFSSNLSPSKPGRFIEMILSFLMMLFFFVMIGSLASNTYQNLMSYITRFGEVAGQMVLVEPLYEDICGQYYIYYYALDGDFYNNFDSAISLLKQDKYWGIIADQTFLLDKIDSGLKLNTYPFITFSYSGIYSSTLSESLANKITRALAGLDKGKIQDILEKYSLNYEVSSKKKEIITLNDSFAIISAIACSFILALILSTIPQNDFYIEIWDKICSRRLQYFTELDMTTNNKTEAQISNKAYDESDRFGPAWSNDLSEDYIRLIKTSTLSLIEYESICLECVDRLINHIKDSNIGKKQLLNQIENYINK